MQHNFIRNLLDLKGVIVKKVRYKKNFVKIHIELPVREQTCPHCKSKTTKIKDFLIVNQKRLKLKITELKLLRIFQFALKPLYFLTENADINVKNVERLSTKKLISYLKGLEKLLG